MGADVFPRLGVGEVCVQPTIIAKQSGLTFADLELHFASRKAVCGGNCVIMKKTSFRLLIYLISHAGDVVSRQSIFQNVWGVSFDPGTKRLEVQLNYLRTVLRVLNSSTFIETHRGKGLKICEGSLRAFGKLGEAR